MGIPVVQSFIDAGVNVGKAWNWGYDMNDNLKAEGIRGLSKGLPNKVGSVGGLMTVGGAAGIGVAAGATIGGMSTRTQEGALIGGAVGGAVGAAAIPALGYASNIGMSAIKTGANKVMETASDPVARGKMGSAIKAGMTNVTNGVMNTSAQYSALTQGSKRVLNPGSRYVGALDNLSKKMATYTPRIEQLDAATNKLTTKGGLKLTGLGKGILAAGAIAGATKDAIHEIDKSRMGTVDNYITRATPRTPSYSNDAGASGDLVFALNANRRG